MVQYLFAAFTLKPKYAALVGPPEPSSDGLLGIAIQEMQHLASVNKLLVALGSGPNLERQDFPNEPDIYPFPMSLERLTRSRPWPGTPMWKLAGTVFQWTVR